ncbi:hypothetical protein [Erythrobacter aureus]|uniref:hypothetical protein n=1 Tax=Erythrobacter aureus TaxID=2182384 RepID=UPI003A94BDD4
MQEDRVTFFGRTYRGWRAKALTGVPLVAGVYQFGCDQFGFPTISTVYGMTPLPWWGWLLLAQVGVLYGLFEYVRLNVRPMKAVSLEGGAPEVRSDKSLAASSILILRRLQAHQGTRAWIQNERDPLADVVRDGASLLLTFEKAGFHVPDFFSLDLVHQRAACLHAYLDVVMPLLRDGHGQEARKLAFDASRNAEKAARGNG